MVSDSEQLLVLANLERFSYPYILKTLSVKWNGFTVI